MTDRDDVRNEAERTARDAVRRLSVRGADPEFRARIGALFASGDLPSAGLSPLVDPGAVGVPPVLSAGDQAREMPDAPTRRGGLTHRGALALRPFVWALAAAAVLLLVWTLFPRGQAEVWQVASAEGPGQVFLSAVAYDVDAVRSMRIDPGTRVRTDGSVVLELVREGYYAIELAPGTDFTLPLVSDHGVHMASVRGGVATCETGPAFAGCELSIEAPDASVEVHGTTFAVLADEEKTCVSVLEGEVDVRTPDGRVRSVPAGRCRRVYRAPEPREMEDGLSAGQLTNLSYWHDRSRELFRAGVPAER